MTARHLSPAARVGVVGLACLTAASPSHAQPTRMRAGSAITVAEQRFDSSTGAGSAVTVLERRLEGPAGPVAPADADSGVARLPTASPCGPTRTCVPGWDLRLVSLGFGAAQLPKGGRVSVVARVENRGLAASPASALRLCWSSGATARCAQRIAPLDLPALGPGEALRVAYPIVLGSLPADRIAGAIDPDNATREANRANNAAVTARIELAAPELQILGLEVPSELRVGANAIPVTIRIRNKSASVASPATDLQLGRTPSDKLNVAYETCFGNWGNGTTRIEVPALQPRQVWMARLVVRPGVIACNQMAGQQVPVTVSVDPDQRVAWGPAHEATTSATYQVVR